MYAAPCVHADLRDQRAGDLEEVLIDGHVQSRVSAFQLGGVDLGAALHQQAQTTVTVATNRQVKRGQT